MLRQVSSENRKRPNRRSMTPQQIHEFYAAKFVKLFEVSDGCWEWRGVRHTGGYGFFSYHCENVIEKYAHRVSYIVHVGPIPDGLFICHHCDNKNCVNPAHVYAGTLKDNSRDNIERNPKFVEHLRSWASKAGASRKKSGIL